MSSRQRLAKKIASKLVKKSWYSRRWITDRDQIVDGQLKPEDWRLTIEKNIDPKWKHDEEAPNKLTIKHLRGSVLPFVLPFESGKKLTVVYGENGSGKSTICDALEF